MILTYGNRHGGAAELAKKLCDECGIAVNYINVIMMVDNWLPSFDMNEQKKIDKKIDENMNRIRTDINDRKDMIFEVMDTDRATHQQFMDAMSRMPADVWQHLLWVTDAFLAVRQSSCCFSWLMS